MMRLREKSAEQDFAFFKTLSSDALRQSRQPGARFALALAWTVILAVSGVGLLGVWILMSFPPSVMSLR